MQREQPIKERVEHARSTDSPAAQLLATEAVYLVSREPERPILRDHLRIPPGAGSAVIGVVLDPVDLEHDAGPPR